MSCSLGLWIAAPAARTIDARKRGGRPRWGRQHVGRASARGPVRACTTKVGRMALRVVFADDNYLVREGVSALLAEVEGIDVVAAASDLESLMSAVAEHAPDAVLTDIRMPPTHTDEGIEAAKRIHSEH